jgi:diguanylate cyclase (GGDEF)-like protein
VNKAATAIENAKFHREMELLAITDALTELHNHRFFQEQLEDEFERAKRFNIPMSLIIADIDRFKRVNDAYGHQQGDLVLKEMAGIIKKNVRKIDTIARYGGEEFAIILPGTNATAAESIGERIRKEVAQHVFSGNKNPISLTLSLGISTYPNSEVKDKEDLIRLADQALYEAKGKGRNRVVVYK